jgi:hypothetical protein
MIQPKSRLFLSGALVVLGAGLMSGATISLDDAGTDPPLTSPFFSFQTDQLGSFMGQFDNQSNPPVDFTFLQLTAAFSPGFWNGPMGPPQTGTFCNGQNAFATCNITVESSIFTLVFLFSGLDANHHGIPVGHILGVTALGFEPEQTITAQAAPAPEPSAFALAGMGFGLLILVVGGQKLLEFRVRP